MKVLLLANHLNPGGVSAYCLMLGRRLKGSGVEICVASGGGRWEGLAERHGIRHFRLPLNTSSELNPKLLNAVSGLRRLIREEGIHILHDQTRVTQVVSALAVRNMSGVRRVSTCHGYFKTRFFRRLMPLWGERVIAVSDAVALHLKNDWKLPPQRIRVIPHGFAGDTAPSDMMSRDVMRSHWRTRDGEIVVGALGRFSPVKGYDILVRALGRLKDASVRAVIAGEGAEAENLAYLAASEGVAERVVFTKAVDDAPEFFGAIDMFCAPSRAEGFGLSILEAMGSGSAVIASRVGAIPDIVEDGATGLLVRPEDPEDLAKAIRRLAGDAGLRRKMGEAGRRRTLEKFPIQAMMDGTRAVYEELGRP